MYGLKNVILFANKGDDDYVQDICDILNVEKGVVEISRHQDSDPYLRINTDIKSINGYTTWFISRYKKNSEKDWLNMLYFAQAAHSEGAGSMNAFETYTGLSRQERKTKAGESITLRTKISAIEDAGYNSFLTFSIHADGTGLGFKKTRFDSYPVWPAMLYIIRREILGDIKIAKPDNGQIKIVGPDHGSAKMLDKILDSSSIKYNKTFAKDFALIDKKRISGKKTKARNIVGNVKGYNIIIFDDESVTGGSISEAAKLYKKKGAKQVYVGLTHPKFTLIKDGRDKIVEELGNNIDKLLISNSCYMPKSFYRSLGENKSKVVEIPTQPLVADHIRCTAERDSINHLHSGIGFIEGYLKVRNMYENAISRKLDKYEPEKFKNIKSMYERLAEPVLGSLKTFFI